MAAGQCLDGAVAEHSTAEVAPTEAVPRRRGGTGIFNAEARGGGTGSGNTAAWIDTAAARGGYR